MKDSKRFCLDTSVFVNSWRKHHRPDVFPTFWSVLDRLIKRKVVFSCREVFEELCDQDDDLTAWAKARRKMFEEPTEETLLELSQLMAAFTNFAATGGSTNAADPWVIAHARLGKAIVVTDEQFSAKQKPTKPPKIPNVCAELDTPCMGICDFLSHAGIAI